MQMNSLDAITVNLDPGVEGLPYEPDVDIRDWMRIDAVMKEHGLGPNGAQVMCADMLALEAKEVKKVIDGFRTDYVLIDTPGQIELFNFREASRVVVDTFGADKSAMAFLFDPILTRTPGGFVSLLLLSSTLQFRFSVPQMNILAKSDILTDQEIATVMDWTKEPEMLIDALLSADPSMHRELNVEFFKALENLGSYRGITPVSSETNSGLEDLYNIIQQTFMGGEDLRGD